MEEKSTNDDKIKALERRIADLKRQWPAHSIPLAMLQLLDDLEEELEQAKASSSGASQRD